MRTAQIVTGQAGSEADHNIRRFRIANCEYKIGPVIVNNVPVCKDVVVAAEEPIVPSEELPNGADGGACNVGNKPEPWATPNRHGKLVDYTTRKQTPNVYIQNTSVYNRRVKTINAVFVVN